MRKNCSYLFTNYQLLTIGRRSMSYTDFDFPHSDYYRSDLRQLIADMKKLEEIVKTFVTLNTITFADPIQWNITTQYAKSTIVINATGNASISKQAVPTGIQLNNDEYWLEIFNFTAYTRTANRNLTVNVETNTARATGNYSVDDWLIWEDVLYKVTSAISTDDVLAIGTNLSRFTVEDFCRAWQTYMVDTIQQYKNDIDASELAYKNEIDASEARYRSELASDIANTTASLQAQLDAAIAGATVDSEVINARVGVDGAIYANLGTAIRTQVGYLNDDVRYLAEDFALNDYLQNAFVLFRWNDTYGYVSNQTAMSIATIQSFPFDVILTNLHFPDFISIVVRTFTLRNTGPAYVDTVTTYTCYGDDAVSRIVLPKNTYWTVQLTRPGNVNIDLNTYKVIPQFIAGDGIKMENQLKLNNTLVVGKKMSPYTKIQDAVDAAQSGDTVLILPGTYEEDISAWGKEIHLVGIDRDSTIIIERSGLYSHPTLEINIGSVRNLTLIETGENSSWGDDDGKGRAYTVHIENGDGYTGVGELWFDNCKLINNKHAAIGCGLYQNLHVHFNNCYMYSGRASDVTDDRYRGTFYYHTNIEENVSGQRMTVKDCEIINEDTKCFFGGVAMPGATTGNVRSTFINNNFYAVNAEAQNSNDLCVVYNILNFHDCKLNGNSRGNNIPVLNAP